MGTHMHISKWFLTQNPRPDAQFRLFCFPYAGGSAAAYAAWGKLIPPNVELVAIQPPGRANRMNEKLLTSVEQMADQISQVIAPLLDRPYVIYGHSLGAAVSFEFLHKLHERRLPPPIRYFCGARRAAHNAPRIPPIHDYPLEQFKSELRDSYGTSEMILNNPELMEIFAPILRTDFAAAYAYRRRPLVKLECEVSAFCGAADDKVLFEDMVGWQEHFTKAVDFKVFEGGHMFLDENREAVIDAVCASFAQESRNDILCKADC
jgi:medium-chain acyl-[acyl-carrier-protein] hydrolase